VKCGGVVAVRIRTVTTIFLSILSQTEKTQHGDDDDHEPNDIDNVVHA
jgi:hypothetical protein